MSIVNSVKKSLKLHQKYHRGTKSTHKIIRSNNFTYRLLIEVIKKNLKGNNLNILDIGCGAGTLSFYLASKGHHITGIDISQKAINECIKSAKKINLKNTKFMRASFPEEFVLKKQFDAIIFIEVIEHTSNDRKALKEIYKLLQPNGILILSTPSITAPLHRLGLTKKFDKEVGHLRRYDLKQLKNLLQSKGFKIIETKKTEGILRNFLFVNPSAGKLVRYVNFFASDFVTFLDNISLKMFGESNYIIVARKSSKMKI